MELSDLIPTFGNTIYTIGAFIIALSIIVAIHEYGHYIVGRWCGIRSEVFSIGFGPVLWSRMDRRGTRWQIAAVPLGGYVKFLGDAGAASDKASDEFEKMDAETRRHTMHGAPLWARAATVAAGPVFNFILSTLVFGLVILVSGVASDPLTVGTLNQTPGLERQLQPGDEILAIEGDETPDVAEFRSFVSDLPSQPELTYTIRRDGTEREVTAPYPYPALVAAVTAGSAGMEAGLEQGDVITAIDGEPIVTFDQLREIVGNSGGREMTMTVWRDGSEFDMTITPRRMDLPLRDGSFETRWLVGFTGGMIFEPETDMPGLGQALGYGLDQTYFIIRSSVSGLYNMVAGAIDRCNMRGIIGIAETSGAAARQGIESFIWFIAVLSAAVGLLNLFPIPVLDGGHLVFHVYEAATGRPPSDGALRILMTVGLALLFTLMAFALYNDIFCP